MIQGTPKFDGLTIAKIEVDYLKNPIHIDVQAAFCNVGTGDTHGWTRGSPGWSEQTRQLLARLRESMEEDLARFHFMGDGGAAPVTKQYTGGAANGGLAEHLGAEQNTEQGTPSV